MSCVRATGGLAKCTRRQSDISTANPIQFLLRHNVGTNEQRQGQTTAKEDRTIRNLRGSSAEAEPSGTEWETTTLQLALLRNRAT